VSLSYVIVSHVRIIVLRYRLTC